MLPTKLIEENGLSYVEVVVSLPGATSHKAFSETALPFCELLAKPLYKNSNFWFLNWTLISEIWQRSLMGILKIFCKDIYDLVNRCQREWNPNMLQITVRYLRGTFQKLNSQESRETFLSFNISLII